MSGGLLYLFCRVLITFYSFFQPSTLIFCWSNQKEFHCFIWPMPFIHASNKDMTSYCVLVDNESAKMFKIRDCKIELNGTQETLQVGESEWGCKVHMFEESNTRQCRILHCPLSQSPRACPWSVPDTMVELWGVTEMLSFLCSTVCNFTVLMSLYNNGFILICCVIMFYMSSSYLLNSHLNKNIMVSCSVITLHSE